MGGCQPLGDKVAREPPQEVSGVGLQPPPWAGGGGEPLPFSLEYSTIRKGFAVSKGSWNKWWSHISLWRCHEGQRYKVKKKKKNSKDIMLCVVNSTNAKT